MATFADDLTAIRDSLTQELKGEMVRRAAIVAAGNPPPTTYTVGGKNVDWNGYLSATLQHIAELNQQVLAAGGDGGLYEISERAYT